IGKDYRGERIQMGRYKEFYQCDIDIVGNNSIDIRNDAVVPAVLYQVFKQLNVANTVININNRKSLNGFLNSLEIENYIELRRVIDNINKVDSNKFRDMLKIEVPH